MLVAIAEIKLYAPWVHSLKEKRMVVKSICARVNNKFNASTAEVGENDIHQTIVIGIAVVVNEIKHGESVIQNIINFIEENTEAEITSVQREFY